MKASRLILCLASSAMLIAGGAFAAEKAAGAQTTTGKAARPDREAMRAYHEKVLSIYDENGDGILDDVEREVLKADIDSGVVEPPPGRGGPRSHRGPPPEILAQYDADGDGVLSEEEHAAIRADIESGQLVPPGRGPKNPPPVKAETGN
ncbi:MAG TPA: hypothetical protein VGA56_16905 [Opitutaceae bacterium]